MKELMNYLSYLEKKKEEARILGWIKDKEDYERKIKLLKKGAINF